MFYIVSLEKLKHPSDLCAEVGRRLFNCPGGYRSWSCEELIKARPHSLVFDVRHESIASIGWTYRNLPIGIRCGAVTQARHSVVCLTSQPTDEFEHQQDGHIGPSRSADILYSDIRSFGAVLSPNLI